MDPSKFKVTSIGKIGPQTSFRIQTCQASIDKEIENSSRTAHTWLQLERVLQNIKGQAIATMIGHIQEHGDVIVKVQLSSSAKNEWDFAERLRNVQGFIRYLWYFTCAGDAKYIEEFSPLPTNKRLCTKKGSQMGIIMMPYYHQGSFLDYLEKTHESHKPMYVKLILCKIVYYVFKAYADKGFTHGDLFAKNIVLDKSDPVIIDFEKSAFSSTDRVQRFWRDLDDLFGDVARYLMKDELNEIARIYIYLNLAYNKEPTVHMIQNICKALQSINVA